LILLPVNAWLWPRLCCQAITRKEWSATATILTALSLLLPPTSARVRQKSNFPFLKGRVVLHQWVRTRVGELQFADIQVRTGFTPIGATQQ
jgi:hypothetical protein